MDWTPSEFKIVVKLLQNSRWEGEHLLWAGPVTGQRVKYGYVSVNRKSQPVHRVAYELFIGPIGHDENGKTLCVMHRCDIPTCINPSCLATGTLADNNADMIAKGRQNNQKKTHCKNGHPFDAENTAYSGNQRVCRTCRRAYMANRYRKGRAA